MSWIAVSLAWGFIYLVAVSLTGGVVNALLERRGHPETANAVMGWATLAGWVVIAWLGYHGSLPQRYHLGTLMPFLGQLIAWCLGLGLTVGLTGAYIGYREVSKVWARQEGASGLIILYPAGLGCIAGGLLGLVIVIVKMVL